jgi:hypothetical protein
MVLKNSDILHKLGQPEPNQNSQKEKLLNDTATLSGIAITGFGLHPSGQLWK